MSTTSNQFQRVVKPPLPTYVRWMQGVIVPLLEMQMEVLRAKLASANDEPNRGIGYLQDSSTILRLAAEYLDGST